MACVNDRCLLTSQITSNSVLVYTEEDGIGAVMAFTVYASDGTTVVKAVSASDPAWGAVSPSSIVVDGLTPDTTYVLKLDAHTEVAETITTLTNDPKVATESQWKDLVVRVKAAGPGKARVLTTADYNYPAGNPTYVALWLLEPGVYAADNMSGSINVRTHINSSDYHSGVFIVGGRQDTYSPSTLYQVPIIVKAVGANKFVVTYGAGGLGSIFDLDDCLLKSNVVQTTGSSTSWVMSQNATTSMVYKDPSTKYDVQIGASAFANGTNYCDVAIGWAAKAAGINAVAIGAKAGSAAAQPNYTVNLGSFSNATQKGQCDISTLATTNDYGYNNSQYRLLTGLYNPQSAHDAATKGYVDPTTDSAAPTTATVGRLGQIQIDTTNADAYMCVAVDSVTPAYTWKKITP